MIKNGKLFGKINLIDFLVILVLVVAVAAVALFILKPKDGQDTLVMKFRIEEVDEFVAEKVNVGDALYDDTYSLDLGYVTDIELDDSISYGNATNGVYTAGTREGYYSMVITGECKGDKTKLGAEIGGKKYGVGHTFVLRAGDAKLYLRVYDIQLKEDVEKEESNKVEEVLTDVKVTLYAPEVESFVAESVKTGAKVKNVDRNGKLGTVSNIVLAESESYYETADGIKAGSVENFNAVTVECSAQGKITEDGVEVDGKVYCIGDEFIARIGNTSFTVMVRSLG